MSDQTGSLFSEPAPEDDGAAPAPAPLAERMRPRTLGEMVGQGHLLAEGKFLRGAIEAGTLPSLLLWGPPGVGKTTMARAIASQSEAHFVALSAVLSGVKDVKKVVAEADFFRTAHQKQTILFVDEIHRFNKAQQDAFLPHVEAGTITLIGATTENPSFQVIGPLLSRCRVLQLEPLSDQDLLEVMERALKDGERGLGGLELEYDPAALRHIALFANGDARMALNSLEIASQLIQAMGSRRAVPPLNLEIAREALQKQTLLYDRAGEEHFNLISALQKSIRSSDADAALYWLARMLEAGEDPLYIARRLVRCASEDIGLADPSALGRAIDALRAVQFIGLPEGKLALAQAAIYLAAAPKSNALEQAYGRACQAISENRREGVPMHLRNAPTSLMKEFGYGEGYRHGHDDEGIPPMECLPGLRNAFSVILAWGPILLLLPLGQIDVLSARQPLFVNLG